MTFLLAEREMIESMVEPAGLPTRSEVDEIHLSVQELKRRVRALEKASAAAEPTQRPASPRRTPARKAARHEGTPA